MALHIRQCRRQTIGEQGGSFASDGVGDLRPQVPGRASQLIDDRRRIGTIRRETAVGDDRHQQPRGVRRRLHSDDVQTSKHVVTAIGEDFVERLGDLMAELQRFPIVPTASGSVPGSSARPRRLRFPRVQTVPFRNVHAKPAHVFPRGHVVAHGHTLKEDQGLIRNRDRARRRRTATVARRRMDDSFERGSVCEGRGRTPLF